MPFGKNAGHDIRVEVNGSQASGTFKFRLAEDRGRKLWRVSEAPITGGPFADFIASDWTFGAGLDRFDQIDEVGHVLRIRDGYGVDLSNGRIEHGPGSTTVGTVSGTVVKFILFLDEVWILTSSRLYRYDGTTLTLFWGPTASGATHETANGGDTGFTDIEKFDDKLYICNGTNIYRTDGTTDPATGDSTDNADFLLALQTEDGPQLWRAYDVNLIASTTNPDTATPTWSTAITVGEGDSINSLYSLSGLLFVGTDSTIYSITSAGVAIEMDKRLKSRRSSSAFSIVSNSGSDVWLSDGSQDVLQMLAVDFEQFELRPNGPFHNKQEVPLTALDTRGNVTAITQDVEHVYVAVERGSDVYVYKGVERGRGLWGWSPLIRIASATNEAMGVVKLTTDTEPFLYVNGGTTIYKYQIRDWSIYNLSWQVEFPAFENGDENEVKVWHRCLVFAERGDDGTNDVSVQAARKLDAATSFTNFGSAFSGTGTNTVITGILTGRKISVRLTMTSTDADDHIDIRSIRLEGVRKPELKLLVDFTVVIDTKEQADFLRNARREGTAFVLLTDRWGVQRQGIILPGFPEEVEIIDENIHGPLRAYRIVMQEVLST